MSLKLYLTINFFIFLTLLLGLSLLISIFTCIVQSDFIFLYLYIYRCISHIFEAYYLFCLSSFFILFNLITFYFKKTRNLAFIGFISIILGVVLNDYELRVLFVYKSQPIDQNFYIYFISYLIAVLLWYTILKKVWNLK